MKTQSAKGHRDNGYSQRYRPVPGGDVSRTRMAGCRLLEGAKLHRTSKLLSLRSGRRRRRRRRARTLSRASRWLAPSRRGRSRRARAASWRCNASTPRDADLLKSLALDRNCCGAPLSAHWGIPDPAADGDFDAAYARLRRRVEALVALPVESMSQDNLRAALAEIHR